MTLPARSLMASCATKLSAATIGQVEPVRLVEREEVVAMLFAIADLNAKVGRILQLLEEELGGGEALPEDDA
jgi:hypothetical protein